MKLFFSANQVQVIYPLFVSPKDSDDDDDKVLPAIEEPLVFSSSSDDEGSESVSEIESEDIVNPGAEGTDKEE